MGAPAAARDGGKTAGAGLAPPTAAASETANGDARDCAPTERAGGRSLTSTGRAGPTMAGSPAARSIITST
ncbi:hypothetical protein WJ970_22015 [Achromobacter xylosoxidans]